MQRRHARHASPVLGLFGMVAQQHDAAGHLLNGRLPDQPYSPLAIEAFGGPCRGMKKVQQCRIIYRRQAQRPDDGSDAVNFLARYHAGKRHYEPCEGRLPRERRTKRPEQPFQITHHKKTPLCC